MRRIVIALYLLIIFIIIISLDIIPLNDAGSLALFYMANYIKDTGAYNAVAAIYLNYRVFDTIFEALLLLVSVIGIIHFSRHEGDY